MQQTAVEGQTQKLQIWRPAGTSGGRNIPKPRQLSNLFLGRGAVQGARDGLKEIRETVLVSPAYQRSTSASSPSAWRGHGCSRLPPSRRRDLSPTFQASRPASSPDQNTCRLPPLRITPQPGSDHAAPSGPHWPAPCRSGADWPAAKDTPPTGSGVFWFARAPRPGPLPPRRPAPPAPRGPRGGRAARGKEGGGARRLQALGTPPPARRARATSATRGAPDPQLCVACRPSGTMHSPGSTGTGDARAVSDGAERGARRGTREGWRLLAAREAGAVLRSWSGPPRGSAGSGRGGGVLARQPAFSFVSCPLRPRPARLFPAMTSPESRGGPLPGVGAAGGNV